MYEVLGLFILLIVGVVLLGEAGHAVGDKDLYIKVFDREIVPMSKSTFYFSVIVLVAVGGIQSGYARKLNAERETAQKHS
jgi:predicted tellurium resistance membrane protein TerC